MISHTPAPWSAKLGPFDFSNDGSRPIMAGEGDARKRIAMVDSVIERKRSTPYDAPDPERDANARLIAAAPEMREACRASLDFLEGIEACPMRTALYQQLKSILSRTEPK